MDLDMYAHPATQEVHRKLKAYGDTVVEAESGELASGLSGQGRLPEPEQLVEQLRAILQKKDQLKAPALNAGSTSNSTKNYHKAWGGREVLITAGPTYERLDPVRFLGNFSSGKMGYALARFAIERGARVTLVSGPVHLQKPEGLAEFVQVESAQQMLEACHKGATRMDVMIFAAAVADYRPDAISPTKIKKTGGHLELKLAENVDIAGTLSKAKHGGQLAVGFALENGLALKPALDKLARKNLDAIVFNSIDTNLGQGQTVMGSDYNQAIMVTAAGREIPFPMATKDQIANQILDELETLFTAQPEAGAA
jgi:phosphopantothenoylcysteine decarboxylase/phosphopantothenate--cysteine ligase